MAWAEKTNQHRLRAGERKKNKSGYHPTLFETSAPYYDNIKNGKIFTPPHDKTGDHKVNVDALEWHYLTGDGDFRSAEIKKLRDEADFLCKTHNQAKGNRSSRSARKICNGKRLRKQAFQYRFIFMIFIHGISKGWHFTFLPISIE